MSHIRLKSVKVKNYRSFGIVQEFIFPDENYRMPIPIVGYNNSGKTNLLNAILYGIGFNYVSKETFDFNDFHNRISTNVPDIEVIIESSIEKKYDGKNANLNGIHRLNISVDGNDIIGAKIESFHEQDGTQNWQAFGASKYFNVFYINFHKIKDEISTQKTSWGNLKSFLAKHIKKIVDTDEQMAGKKSAFKTDIKDATEKILRDSKLSKFVKDIKDNYSKNLRNNNCEVTFELPEYEDIFLQMLFKIGLNGDISNLIPVTHFGDGYISMFVMAIIQSIAECNTTDKCLFLFEEPESFLHENHQEYFYKAVLCKLADRGHQVIYTTHSDRMVDIFDTKGIIRIEFDETQKCTVKKYNQIAAFSPQETIENNGHDEIITLEHYNSFIKNIEPNLNKILFSRKVVLVEGPNDIMSYKYAVEKIIQDLGYDKLYAETYLQFKNIAFIAHHGKITALLLIKLCKHLGLDYFVINDWDLDTDFVQSLNDFASVEDLKASDSYRMIDGRDTTKTEKGIINTNWKLQSNAGIGKIHFNIKKLETVLGYPADDKDSVGIWNILINLPSFSPAFFPDSLRAFLELDNFSPLSATIEAPVQPQTTIDIKDIVIGQDNFLREQDEDSLPF